MSGHEVKENCRQLSTSRWNQESEAELDPPPAPRAPAEPDQLDGYNRKALRFGDQLKGYDLESFLKRSSHLRLASIML